MTRSLYSDTWLLGNTMQATDLQTDNMLVFCITLIINAYNQVIFL